MGGHAFDHHGLQCPRMPRATYERLKQTYTDLLSQFFAHVLCVPEAPGKTDYGDIDLLVSGPWAPENGHPDVLAKHCAAKMFVLCGDVTSLAMPYPKPKNESENEDTVVYPEQKDAWVQLDVHICHPGLLEWTAFFSSYGDLFQILGTSHRWTGLTFNHTGMYVRVADIEPNDKKKSLLFVTREPADVMGFLGLDAGAYENGFRTEEDLFAWVVGGRFFDRRVFEKMGRGGDDGVGESTNANDRQRLKKRHMFSHFVNEYVASHPDVGKGVTATREDILREVVNAFDRTSEYNDRVRTWRRKEREDAFWKKVKALIPKNDKRKLAMVVRGLRRWVRFENRKPIVKTEPLSEPLCWTAEIENMGEEGPATEDEDEARLLAFVLENWAEVYEAEKLWADWQKAAGRSKIEEDNVIAMAEGSGKAGIAGLLRKLQDGRDERDLD